jgi:uncharacterized protein YbbK (DUF523 family)
MVSTFRFRTLEFPGANTDDQSEAVGRPNRVAKTLQKILVSACLLGEKVRYHGGDATSSHPALRRWEKEGRLVSTCPEVEGGLGTPRPPAEIAGHDAGRDVVARAAFVRTGAGVDVTEPFMAGAAAALDAARRHRVRVAILKDGSPSCGSSFVYDGTFSGTRRAGVGVTAALLQLNGVRVFGDHEIDAAEAYLAELDQFT